jgi:cytochrome P450
VTFGIGADGLGNAVTIGRARSSGGPIQLADPSIPGKQPVFLCATYDDVRDVLSDSATFSSNVVGARYGAVLGASTLVSLDTTAHRALRKQLSPIFQPAAIARATQDIIVPIVTDLCCHLTSEQDPDLTRDFARQLPGRVIARLLGVDAAYASRSTRGVPCGRRAP